MLIQTPIAANREVNHGKELEHWRHSLCSLGAAESFNRRGSAAS